MISVLREFKVRAIGLEPVFEARQPEYPEYDDLLATVSASAGNVVATSYFDKVSAGRCELEADSVGGGRMQANVRLVGDAGHRVSRPVRRAARIGRRRGSRKLHRARRRTRCSFRQGSTWNRRSVSRSLRVASGGKVKFLGAGEDGRPGIDDGRVIVSGNRRRIEFDAPGGYRAALVSRAP